MQLLLLEASFSGNTLLRPTLSTHSCNCDISFFGGVVEEIGHLSTCGKVNATCFDNFITNLQDTPIDKGNANVTLDPEAEVKV